MLLIPGEDGKPLLLNPAAIKTIEPHANGTCLIRLMDGETEFVSPAEFRELAQDMAKLKYCGPAGIRR